MKNFGGQTKVCQTSTGDDVHTFKCDQFQNSPLLRMYVCASLFSTVSPAESRQASARGGPSSGDYVCSHVHMVCVCVCAHRFSPSGKRVNFQRGKLERHRWVSLKNEFWTVKSYKRTRKFSVERSVAGASAFSKCTCSDPLPLIPIADRNL